MLSSKRIPYIASIVLLVYMPFHIFLAQSLSLATGGLEAWKIGKDVVLFVAALFTICLMYRRQKATNRTFNTIALATALYGCLHLSLWAVYPEIHSRSAVVGLIYNMRLPLLLLLGYGAVNILPKFAFSSVLKIVLVVSTIVASLGILQYFLPRDVLTHIGYSIERGTRAAFFIDDYHGLPRIMSTLREPNALGAYLILPITALVTLLLHIKNNKQRYILAAALLLHGLALGLTFSRSAWLGAMLAVALVIWWQYGRRLRTGLRNHWVVVAVVLMAVLALGSTLQNTVFFQQYVIHSNPSEQVQDLDSNDYHALLVKQGLEGIARQPWGHGPGTAGLASIQNPAGPKLTENYFVQIGYEVGLAGLILFISLNIWLYRELLKRRHYMATILCASFWAYVLTNLLLHTWSNEAVATQWWLLAGMALATGQAMKGRKKD